MTPDDPAAPPPPAAQGQEPAAAPVSQPDPAAAPPPPAAAAPAASKPAPRGPRAGDMVPYRGYESGGSIEHPAIVTGSNDDGSVDLTVFYRRSAPGFIVGAMEGDDGYFSAPPQG